MRPITLWFEGLRSYRQRQTIDFSDVRLAAIIGDTGSGKSSILEALCAALYGACTWDQRGAGRLIAEGASTMSVELEFEAEGHRWKVFRSLSRGTYPPAVHRLERADDASVRFDQRREVDRKIQALVGLDYDAFLRAVVLPQGRFQLLLQSTPTERTRILRGIFRVDRIAEVREVAVAARQRLELRAAELRTDRARLLPDPTASAQAARAEAESARAEAGRLEAIRAALREDERAAEAAERRAAAIAQAVTRLEPAAVPDAGPRAEALDRLETELDGAAREAEARRSGEEARLVERTAALERAESEGLGPRALGVAASRLDRLAAVLAERGAAAEARAEAEAEHTAVLARGAELEAREAVRREEAARRAEALTAARAAREAAREARGRAEAARLEALRTEGDAARAEQEADGRRGEHAAAREAAEAAEAERRAAEQARAEADTLRDAASRANAAAHAAAGCGTGDPCPVCARPLPEAFRAPTAPDLEAAVQASRAAERRLETASTAAARTAERRDATGQEATRAETAAAEARARAREARAALDALAPGEDLEPDRLAALDAALEASTTAVAEADAARDEAHTALTAVETERRAATEGRAGAERRLEASLARQEALEAELETLRRALPPALEASGIDRAEAVPAVRARLEAARAHAETLESEAGEARAASEAARRHEETLRERRRSELERPRDALLVQLERWAERLEALRLVAAPERPTLGPGAASPVSAAARLTGETETLRALAATARGAAEAEASAAARRRTERLGEAGAPDPEALERLWVTAAGRVEAALREAEAAEAQVAPAAALDARLGPIGPRLDVLEALSAALVDSQFVGFLVERKQRSLLAVASRLLGSMTGEAYGFGEGFEIVDRVTGAARDVKTLSGGESFLASLALALALVELARRGGGRLDALFLDEGFGTLDAAALGDALDELARQAEQGRVVAVISHLRAVAEHIDRVLAVEKGPDGSRAVWLDDAARERFLEDDAAHGLLH